MNELENFVCKIKKIAPQNSFDISAAREIVKLINEFLFTTHDNIGTVRELEKDYPYFSEFHRYWDNNYKDIINAKISDEQSKKVVDVLHHIYKTSNGVAFTEIYDTNGLSKQQICKVRFLTANQDFRGSRSFGELASVYINDPSIFDINYIESDPEGFVKSISVNNLSQNDKRISYAKNIAKFVKAYNITEPYDLISKFNNDLVALKQALTNSIGSGYGNKKADMFLRDMVVLGVWNNVKGFENINVASDLNTIKVALRTGILQTSIPLVSSFLDYFGKQYSYIDDMSALAWRRVWELWKNKYPSEVISSPSLLDYFIYNVVGRTFCKSGLYEFECDEKGHKFKWHSPKNKTCQICYENERKKVSAHIINRMLPCDSNEGNIMIMQTDFYKKKICNPNINNCPFKSVCDNYGMKYLLPPKAISIEGKTGWSTAYTDSKSGGGGLMA